MQNIFMTQPNTKLIPPLWIMQTPIKLLLWTHLALSRGRLQTSLGFNIVKMFAVKRRHTWKFVCFNSCLCLILERRHQSIKRASCAENTCVAENSYVAKCLCVSYNFTAILLRYFRCFFLILFVSTQSYIFWTSSYYNFLKFKFLLRK